MPNVKTKPTQIRKIEPRATPDRPMVPEQPEPQTPNLTSLLLKFLEFDAKSDAESRELLSRTFDRWKKSEFPFPVTAAACALRAVGVRVTMESLEEPEFVKLLDLFCMALIDGGFREELISRLLTDPAKEHLTIEGVFSILTIEFQQKLSDLAVARQALKNYPEELADAIREASSRSI